MEKFDAKCYRRALLVRYVLSELVSLLMLGILIYRIYRIVNEGEDCSGWTSTSCLFYILHMVMLRNPGRPVIKVFKAIKDDMELRRAWNAEHDERYLYICAKAGIPLMPDTAIALTCIGMLVSICEWRIGSGIVLASLLMNCVSSFAYTFWHKRLSQEVEEDSEEV